MSFIDKKPPEFRHGTRQLNVKHLNQIRDMLYRQVRGGVGVSVSDFGDRTVIGKPDERIVNPDILIACTVIEEFDDYLLCLPLNTSTPASPSVDPAFIATPPIYNNDPQGTFPDDRLIYIAKPWLLQRKPFEGQTVSVAGVDTTYTYPGTSSLTVDPPSMDHTGGVRTATPDGGSGVTETIWPPYIIGDIITAVYRFTGYYDPNQVNQTSPASGDPLIEWQDVNEAGRTWREPSGGGASDSRKSLFKSIGSDFSVTSTTMTDVTSSEVTFNLSVATKLTLTVHALLQITPDPTDSINMGLVVRPVVDTVNQVGLQTTLQAAAGTLTVAEIRQASKAWEFDMSAGSHTIKLQAARQNVANMGTAINFSVRAATLWHAHIDQGTLSV